MTAIIAMIFAISAYGQSPSYTNFEWEVVSVGYASPSDNVLSSGFSFGSEVRYNLKDNLSLGLQLSVALFSTSGGFLVNSEDLGAVGFYGLTADYYVGTTSPNRAFAGVGLGIMRGGEIQVSNIDESSSFGITPRIGYELGHLRLTATYNLALSNDIPNYIGVSVGLVLWGGYNGSK